MDEKCWASPRLNHSPTARYRRKTQWQTAEPSDSLASETPAFASPFLFLVWARAPRRPLCLARSSCRHSPPNRFAANDNSLPSAAPGAVSRAQQGRTGECGRASEGERAPTPRENGLEVALKCGKSWGCRWRGMRRGKGGGGGGGGDGTATCGPHNRSEEAVASSLAPAKLDAAQCPAPRTAHGPPNASVPRFLGRSLGAPPWALGCLSPLASLPLPWARTQCQLSCDMDSHNRAMSRMNARLLRPDVRFPCRSRTQRRAPAFLFFYCGLFQPCEPQAESGQRGKGFSSAQPPRWLCNPNPPHPLRRRRSSNARTSSTQLVIGAD